MATVSVAVWQPLSVDQPDDKSTTLLPSHVHSNVSECVFYSCPSRNILILALDKKERINEKKICQIYSVSKDELCLSDIKLLGYFLRIEAVK